MSSEGDGPIHDANQPKDSTPVRVAFDAAEGDSVTSVVQVTRDEWGQMLASAIAAATDRTIVALTGPDPSEDYSFVSARPLTERFASGGVVVGRRNPPIVEAADQGSTIVSARATPYEDTTATRLNFLWKQQKTEEVKTLQRQVTELQAEVTMLREAVALALSVSAVPVPQRGRAVRKR